MIHIQGFATVTLALLLTLAGTGLFSFSAPKLFGYNPPNFQRKDVFCPAGTEKMPRNRPVRIMTWNIQSLMGGYYPYWQEDRNPPLKTSDIEESLERIVQVIRDVNPDILQLQEVHLTHPLTFHMNQLEMLYQQLADRLPCYSQASYWKAVLVPKKHMMGNIDMVLVTMSRYQIDEAVQILLPATRKKRLVIPFYPRRSLLEVRIPLQSGGSLNAINTHLDAPSLGRGDMYRQVDAVQGRLELLSANKRLWVLSGDFNLIPPGFYHKLPDNQKEHYNEISLLTPFYKKFRGTPELTDVTGSNWSNWLTAYDINRDKLDLTIDYIFRPDYIQNTNSRVLHLPLDISDHMPVITELILPEENDQLARTE